MLCQRPVHAGRWLPDCHGGVIVGDSVSLIALELLAAVLLLVGWAAGRKLKNGSSVGCVEVDQTTAGARSPGPRFVGGPDASPAEPMAAMRVFFERIHPVFGRGYWLWDQHGFYECHYCQGVCRVIDYVSKEDKKSYLTVFIPFLDGEVEYMKEWVRVRSMDWLSKAAAAKAATKAGDNEVTDDAMQGKFPALYAFMTLTTHEGKPREPCKLQVFADQGAWKAALHDPNTEHSLFVTLQAVQDVFKTMEKHLTAESPDWRSWGKGKGKKR